MSKRSKNDMPKDVGDDNIYDEVDRYHLELDENLTSRKKGRKHVVKEVLSVAIDDDELSDMEDYSANPSAVLPEARESATSNKWGRRRQNFYGTSYVDKDFGGVANSDEEEQLELEEEDAIARQKQNDRANAHVNLADFDADSDSEEDDGASKQIFMGLKDAMAYSRKKRIAALQEQTEKEEAKEKRRRMKEARMAAAHTEDELSADPKRGITYEMQKNKGIMLKKRKKGTQHARVKKRKQYDKALIRRRSQVPDVRPEMVKYDGEKRGIRASTVRSVKLS